MSLKFQELSIENQAWLTRRWFKTCIMPPEVSPQRKLVRERN
jgi:hypothetical protein